MVLVRESLPLVIIVLLVGTLLACGDDDAQSDEVRIAERVNAWNEAFSEGAGDETCALMTTAGQGAMMDPYEGTGPDRPRVTATCEAAVAKLARRIESEPTPPVAATDVRVRGDAAVVQPDSGFCTHVQLVDGDWLVAYLPVPGPDDPDPDTGTIPRCEPGG